MSRRARAVLEWIWPAHPRRIKDIPARIGPPLAEIARLTAATVLAYIASAPFVTGPPDLTGALTALLVVQGTNAGTFRNMLLRVGAVFTGVSVAVLVSALVGLSWWSLAIAVGLALLFAKMFRLTDQALETPISAMLILGAQAQETVVTNRILTTLIGAAIGFLFVFVLPARMPVRRAANRIRSVSTGTANLLTRVSKSMYTQPISHSRAKEWLSEARKLSTDVAAANEAVAVARESRSLNAHAFMSADVGPVLSIGVTSLERIVMEVRNLFHTIELEAPEGETPDDGYGELVRPTFAWVLATLADSIAAYGRLVEADALGSENGASEAELENMLSQLGEARASLAELMTVDATTEQSLWLLRGSILGVLRQIMAELEDEERAEKASRVAEERRKRRITIIPRIAKPNKN